MHVFKDFDTCYFQISLQESCANLYFLQWDAPMAISPHCSQHCVVLFLSPFIPKTIHAHIKNKQNNPISTDLQRAKRTKSSSVLCISSFDTPHPISLPKGTPLKVGGCASRTCFYAFTLHILDHKMNQTIYTLDFLFSFFHLTLYLRHLS